MSKASKKESKEKIILGIDPGTNVMGYGLILTEGKQYKLLQYGVIHLKKYETHEL
nr:crossover junction endodeoxyribonuclease RuvC [Algoriphagus sp.]